MLLSRIATSTQVMIVMKTPVSGAMTAAFTQRSTVPIVRYAATKSCTLSSKFFEKMCTRPNARTLSRPTMNDCVCVERSVCIIVFCALCGTCWLGAHLILGDRERIADHRQLSHLENYPTHIFENEPSKVDKQDGGRKDGRNKDGTHNNSREDHAIEEGPKFKHSWHQDIQNHEVLMFVCVYV